MVRKATSPKAGTPGAKPKKKSNLPICKKVYFTEEEVAQALRENHGLRYLTAEKLDIHPTTLGNYFKRWPDLRKVVKECRRVDIDKVHQTLIQKAIKGDMRAIRYYLSHKAPEEWGPLKKVIEQTTTVGVTGMPVIPEDAKRRILDEVRAKYGLTPSDKNVPLEIGLKELPDARVKVTEVKDGMATGQVVIENGEMFENGKIEQNQEEAK